MDNSEPVFCDNTGLKVRLRGQYPSKKATCPLLYFMTFFWATELKEYFENLWWYMPDAKYVDSQEDFTETDKEFLKK